jgi:hypothetical protein
MKKIVLYTLFFLFVSFTIFSQTHQNLPPGFPDRSANMDVLPGFKNPPKGYGEVSFYWWLGDTLTKERIISQLDQLQSKNITGLQINYCHTDKGGATYGLTYPSQPALFSDKWWELFQWFLQEAKKRDMSVSLSDYTLGAAGQGWFVDEMLKENQNYGSKLEASTFDVKGNQQFKTSVLSDVITAVAYPVANGSLSLNGSIDLKPQIRNSELTWQVPSGDWKIIVVNRKTVKTSFDPMNPVSGAKVAEKFYQRFEDHCPGEAGKGLNFFFSDELQFGIRGFLWNDRFASEFKARKGYDVLPELPHLFVDLSPRSGKIRLDYNDVMVALSEECFFKPLYEWHNSRGMLFGCDHGGRGADVTEFGDYFRTQRWMSGPGCDQPGLGRNIVKNKVASSIAHLYERPRTWLEGYYGSGWGTSSEEVADVTFANFAMGQNLLSLHGLYYSTHGSMWEWAAPDNHWRQPYWVNMGDFLKCSERLSYVLSQGYHRCDVAMIYPVAPVVASLNGKNLTKTAFALANDLYPAGIDFDFMDFESLNRSVVDKKELQVSGEKYSVLILPGLSAVNYSTIEKAIEFFRSGGIVLAVGALPEASDRIGGNDMQLQAMIKEMFGTTFSEKHDTTLVYSQKNKSGGTGLFISNPPEAKKIISNLIQPDFKVLSGNPVPGILHRKIGNRDLYFVYGLPKGTSCFFRATGKAELWNPWDGSTKPLKVSSTSESGTTIALPLEKSEPQLIVFSPGKPEIQTASASNEKPEELVVDGEWEFELKPTLDNRFGDYHLPAFDGKLGVEVWKMKFAEGKTVDQGQNPELDDSQWTTATVGYGPQFWKLGPLPNTLDSAAVEAKLSSLKQIDPNEPVELNGKKYFWKPYEFSWRWGLKDDAGHQGYHGLKGFINDENISLGIIDRSIWAARPIYPLKPEADGTVYYLWSTVSSPGALQSKIIQSGIVPQQIYVNQKLLEKGQDFVQLNEGYNPVLMKYNNIGRGVFVFLNSTVSSWKQTVPLATNWYLNPAVLPYNCNPQAKGQFGWYRFVSPPGTRAIYVTSKAKPEAWVNGKKYSCEPGKLEAERIADTNLQKWKVPLPENLPESAPVVLKIEQIPGFFGGSAISEPVVFECGKGTIRLGDLQGNEALKTYSGGMWYRKSVKVTTEQAKAGQIILDLGKVVSTAEVFVNGKSVGAKVSSPWTFDLSGKLTSGENKIEILVYNTLGNHYLTTISQYVGRTNSGLIGPVLLEFKR